MPSAPVPATRGLVTERIARDLERQIRTGTFTPGAKLPSERELAIRFSASRNVVREVLRRLEAQHLIEVSHGRGSFVKGPAQTGLSGYDAAYREGRPTVRQLVQARLPIEVETAGLAAEHATADDLTSLRQAHETVLQAPDPVAMARADLGFHETIALVSGNPVLHTMLRSIGGLMVEMMLRSNSDPAIAEPGVPHHAEILAAIAAHDVDRARHDMREHLTLGLRTYGADLDEPLDAMADRHLQRLIDQRLIDGEL